MARALGQTSRARVEVFKSWACLCWEHKRNTEHLTHITAYRGHVFFTISNVYIQAVLSVILTFVPRQHVLKLNKHGNDNTSPPINIYFLITGVENNYSFWKSERPWAHESNGWWPHELISLRECSSNFRQAKKLSYSETCVGAWYGWYLRPLQQASRSTTLPTITNQRSYTSVLGLKK